jgi:hypothetical protein
MADIRYCFNWMSIYIKEIYEKVKVSEIIYIEIDISITESLFLI